MEKLCRKKVYALLKMLRKLLALFLSNRLQRKVILFCVFLSYVGDVKLVGQVGPKWVRFV